MLRYLVGVGTLSLLLGMAAVGSAILLAALLMVEL